MADLDTSRSPHQFFRFLPQPRESVVRNLAVLLMNQYTGSSKSRSSWLRHPAVQLDWVTKKEEKVRSAPFSIRAFERALREEFAFDCTRFALPPPNPYSWLDGGYDVGRNFHILDRRHSGPIVINAQVPLGPSFPLVPSLDREGRAVTSFQSVLLKRIAALRQHLVTYSQSPESDEWFQLLRSVVVECVSLIDATLHQLFFKAQYDPLPGWRFDPKALGKRHGVRLNEKLCWVHTITGRHLNAPVHERTAFERLKDLRNHLQHFDPPCFCYTFEDALGWLNDILAVGEFNLRIRRCIGAHVSLELIALLLQREVGLVPNRPDMQRVPQPDTVGYASTVWPAADAPSAP
jgi:hypothetical protein